jgi:hypothetical protein
MIRDIILEYTKVGFMCNTFDHFKLFIDNCKNEGIIFSKGRSIEEYDNIFEKYTKYIRSESYQGVIALVMYDYPVFVAKPEENKKEFQIYSRSITEYQIYLNDSKSDFYKDWHKFKMINYTEMIRDNKLKEIL